MGWVDPLKEANAAAMRKDSLFSTLEQENAAQGNNWRDTLDQQAIERAYAEDLGIDYDSDPATANSSTASDQEEEEDGDERSEEHTSELQSLMRISYAVFSLKKKKQKR